MAPKICHDPEATCSQIEAATSAWRRWSLRLLPCEQSIITGSAMPRAARRAQIC
jgi:hypothetical protein